ncbi:DNA replication and repair protein RecF [Terrimonas sp.]|uniref:DNA replication/repair protein RecF n=1 Tax=Terrimonas sp. TaxID=1914338 RepID=UPI000D506A73|nr:DNA replication and repair protein RecF [Terrimonas sp.]PVD53810.1 DNA replication and repair protein RecF [Terrimonas sp.]
MLILDNISLFQFRNYHSGSFSFSKNIIGFCGKNGSGKTNLLDAIYYLCFTKSYFNKPDAQNTSHGKTGFRIEGNLKKSGTPYKVVCVVRENGKKEFSVDGEIYTKFAAHIGRFPCVMIAPDDVAIITEASDERRKFIDYTISQLDLDYLHNLINYNKLLQQRNSLLKQAAEQGKMDETLFQVISAQLIQNGNLIFKKRQEFCRDFIPMIIALYNEIAKSNEKLSINYISNLESNTFENILKENRTKDLALQRTTKGVHRDDLEFKIDGGSFKSLASQGQRKSLLFALKLAEYETLLQHKGFPPLMLLDDIFEKLDEDRMHNLLSRVCVRNQGQIFITDTHCDRLNEALKRLDVQYQLFNL